MVNRFNFYYRYTFKKSRKFMDSVKWNISYFLHNYTNLSVNANINYDNVVIVLLYVPSGTSTMGGSYSDFDQNLKEQLTKSKQAPLLGLDLWPFRVRGKPMNCSTTLALTTFTCKASKDMNAIPSITSRIFFTGKCKVWDIIMSSC